MCGSMADVQSATAEIRRGKKERKKEERKKKKPQGKNIMVCPILYGDHNKYISEGLMQVAAWYLRAANGARQTS